MVAEASRQNEKEQEMMEDAQQGKSPNSISPGRRNSRSSKAEALKNSQEEEESFINKSMINDND